jgi:LPXTG-motif cell wall-anchored protein
MLAHSLILLPAAGFVLAAATGILIRNRRERDDRRVRSQFRISD